MIEWLKRIDLSILDLINGSGNAFIDQLMIWFSDRYIWIPLYAFLVFQLLLNFKKRFWISLIFVLLTFAFTDQFTATFMKPFFERLRPCNDQSIADIVVSIHGCGGKYGFASSHAANTMGLAFFYFLLLKNDRWLTVPLLVWSVLVGYSRVYLGVHYPGDVLVGFIVGIIGAYLFYSLYQKINLYLFTGSVVQ